MTHSASPSVYEEIAQIYTERARFPYGLEDISQLQHALQSAVLAEANGESPALILASLLHDVGHMIHKLGENPAEEGVNDKHEILGAKWLAKRLPAAVAEPVRMHVEAKRYLCAAEPDYMERLTPDSVLSLKLQGGPMSADEAAAFQQTAYTEEAIRLRRYDEQAKDPAMETPPLEHFLQYLPSAAIGNTERDVFRREGILVLRDFFSSKEAMAFAHLSDEMGAAAEALLREAVTNGKPLTDLLTERPRDLIVVPEATDPTKICRFEYLLGSHAEFRALVETRIAPVIEGLTGERFIPFKDKENEKHPGGGAFGPHQDFAAYRSFGPRYNVTAMVSVDPATCENGCLEFACGWSGFPDAHPNAVEERIGERALLRFEDGGSRNGDIVQEIADVLDWRPVETAPTDLVIFDSFAPHRSSPNGSAVSRRAMFLTFNAEREGDWYERYYAEKRANLDDPKFHVSTPTIHAGD